MSKLRTIRIAKRSQIGRRAVRRLRVWHPGRREKRRVLTAVGRSIRAGQRRRTNGHAYAQRNMIRVDLQVRGRALEHLRARERIRNANRRTIHVGGTKPFGRTLRRCSQRAGDHRIVWDLVVHAEAPLRACHHRERRRHSFFFIYLNTLLRFPNSVRTF